jgi:predicted HTH transcriptional regulator
MMNIGAINRDAGKPTNAGILFFGSNLQGFFLNAQLRIARFKGTDVIHPVIDRLDCRGTLFQMEEALFRWLLHMHF